MVVLIRHIPQGLIREMYEQLNLHCLAQRFSTCVPQHAELNVYLNM